MSKRRVTIDLDEHLLTAVDTMAAQQKQSRSKFIADVVERVLRDKERARIDAAFAQIADDEEYQAELRQIEQEMSPASDAAWRHIDTQSHTGDK